MSVQGEMILKSHKILDLKTPTPNLGVCVFFLLRQVGECGIFFVLRVILIFQAEGESNVTFY